MQAQQNDKKARGGRGGHNKRKIIQKLMRRRARARACPIKTRRGAGGGTNKTTASHAYTQIEDAAPGSKNKREQRGLEGVNLKEERGRRAKKVTVFHQAALPPSAQVAGAPPAPPLARAPAPAAMDATTSSRWCAAGDDGEAGLRRRAANR